MMLSFDAEIIEQTGKRVYETAVKLIKKYGIQIEEEHLLSRILENKEVSGRNKRVFFSEDLIRETVPFGRPAEFDFDYREQSFHYRTGKKRNEHGFVYHLGGFSMAVYDCELGKVRPSTVKDVEEALMLSDVMQIGGHYPCSATDVHPALQNIIVHKLCFTKSRYNCTHVCGGIPQAEYIYRMHRVMGDGAKMPLTLTVTTPFRIEKTNLEIVQYMLEKKVPPDSIKLVPVGYGLGGMNYPVTLGASWAMCLAEHMGVFLAAKLMNTGFEIAPAVGPLGIAPVDFQSMAIALGNPNQMLHNFVNNILSHAALGRNWRTSEQAEVGLWTGSPVPDSQAAAEKMVCALTGMMRGATSFGRLGNLCIDDVFSSEQMLLDMEIIEYARKAIGAFDKLEIFLDIESCLEDIDKFVSEGADFMTASSTMKYLRDIYPPQDLFKYRKLATVTSTDFDRLLQSLQVKKKELLKQYDFSLEPEKEKELNSIYREAERELGR